VRSHRTHDSTTTARATARHAAGPCAAASCVRATRGFAAFAARVRAASTALDQAVGRLVSDGVSLSVAAGNSNANACNSSPARAPAAITVAASTIDDALASFSNRGNCVDIIAPGNQIPGAWSTSNTATMTISGTSMASPHSAGAAAKVLQTQPGLTPAQVASTLTSSATTNHISGTGRRRGVPATPNLLLFTNL